LMFLRVVVGGFTWGWRRGALCVRFGGFVVVLGFVSGLWAYKAA
jgi:hypothetical protein